MSAETEKHHYETLAKCSKCGHGAQVYMNKGEVQKYFSDTLNEMLETARAEVREECAKSVMQGIQPGECYGINTFKDKADKIRSGETKP